MRKKSKILTTLLCIAVISCTAFGRASGGVGGGGGGGGGSGGGGGFSSGGGSNGGHGHYSRYYDRPAPVIGSLWPNSRYELLAIAQHIAFYGVVAAFMFRHHKPRNCYETRMSVKAIRMAKSIAAKSWPSLPKPNTSWSRRVDTLYTTLQRAIATQSLPILSLWLGRALRALLQAQIDTLQRYHRHNHVEVVDILEKGILHQDAAHYLVAVQARVIDYTIAERDGSILSGSEDPTIVWDVLYFHKKYRWSKWKLYDIQAVKHKQTAELNALFYKRLPSKNT